MASPVPHSSHTGTASTAQPLAVIDLTGEQDGPQRSRTPGTQPSSRNQGPQHQPPQSPSLQPTVVLDLMRCDDDAEADKDEGTSTKPEHTPTSIKRPAHVDQAFPSKSKRPRASRTCVQQPQQPVLQHHLQQPPQQQQQLQHPEPQQQQPLPGQQDRFSSLLSDAPFKLMKMNILPDYKNKHCCGVDPAVLVPAGKIQLLVSSNMCPDVRWLLSKCRHAAQAEHFVILHGTSEAMLEDTREYLRGGSSPLLPPHCKLTMHKCPLPYDYGTQHSKFITLKYPSGMRFILHTANPLIGADDISTQAIWWQDFPKKDGMSPPSSDFEDTFVDYITKLGLPAGEREELCSAFRLHDFSSARAFLIPSVPGKHEGQALHKYGHMRVRHVLQQHLDSPPLSCGNDAASFDRRTLPTYFRANPQCSKRPTAGEGSQHQANTSSNLEGAGNNANQAAGCVPEGIVVQPTSIGKIDGNWFFNDFGASLSAVKAQPLRVPLPNAKPLPPKPLAPEMAYVVWPSWEEIRTSVGGWSSGGNVHSSPANMYADNVFLKPLLHRFSGGGANREEAMPHMKSFCRFKGQQLAYAIVGSHNLSKAAWGGPIRKGQQGVLMIRSYELSVLMLPTLEASYRSHRHYNFSCFPSTSTSKPDQRQQQQQQQQAHTKPVQFWSYDSFVSLRHEEEFGMQHQGLVQLQHQRPPAADLESCAFLPIPYYLPPQKYAHGDIPWTYEAPDGLDRYGEKLKRS